MAEVMRNMGVGGNEGAGANISASTSVDSSSRGSQQLFPNLSNQPYAQEMSLLRDYGFTDIEQNARALEETGGNVHQAIELLIALRESVNDMGGGTG